MDITRAPSWPAAQKARDAWMTIFASSALEKDKKSARDEYARWMSRCIRELTGDMPVARTTVR